VQDYIAPFIRAYEDERGAGSASVAEADQFRSYVRHLRGHMVRRLLAGRLLMEAHPEAFELSFPIPRGISGAPLFVARNGVWTGIGVCVGNQPAEVLDFEHSEVDENGQEIIEKGRFVSRNTASRTSFEGSPNGGPTAYRDSLRSDNRFGGVMAFAATPLPKPPKCSGHREFRSEAYPCFPDGGVHPRSSSNSLS